MIETDAKGDVIRFACTIWVIPPSKKRSIKVTTIGGHASIGPTYEFIKVTREAVRQLTEQAREFVRHADNVALLPLAGRIHARMIFHILCTSDNKNAPDLPNLLHAPLDWMQPAVLHEDGRVKTPGAGIIADDRFVDSVDGSRRVFECDGCPDRRRGCNYRFEPVLYTSGKRAGQPRLDRKNNKPMKKKIQVCQKAQIEIQLMVIEEEARRPRRLALVASEPI